MPRSLSVPLIASLVALAVFIDVSRAQVSWPAQMDGSAIKLQYLFPSYKTSGSTEITAYNISLTGQVLVSENTLLVFDLPFLSTTTKYSSPFTGSVSASKSSVGNIYIGMRADNPRGPTIGTVGVRIPTLSESSAAAGSGMMLADLEHFETYMLKYITILGGIAYVPTASGGLNFLLRAGPSLFIPTDSDAGHKTQLLVDYGAGIGVDQPDFRVGLSISGRVILTEEHFLSDKRALHFFEAGANVKVGSIRPGAFIRIPLESEISQYLRQLIGIYASVSF